MANVENNPSFETDTSDWSATSSGTSLTRVTSDAWVGSACGSWSRDSGSGNMVLITDFGLYAASEGQDWSTGARVKLGAGTAREVRCDIRWLDDTVTEIGGDNGFGDEVLVDGVSWQLVQNEGAMAPANTAFVARRLVYLAAASGDTCLVDGAQLNEGATLETYNEGGTSGTVDVPALSLSVGVSAPTVEAETTLSGEPLALSLGFPASAVSGAAKVAVSPLNLVVGTPAPTVLSGIAVPVLPLNLTVGTPAPSVSGDAVISMPPPNLYPDGGFETSENWNSVVSSTEPARDQTHVRSGDWALRCRQGAGTSVLYGVDSGIASLLPDGAGEYMATVHLWIPASVNDDQGVRIGGAGAVNVDVLSPLRDQWVEFTVTFEWDGVGAVNLYTRGATVDAANEAWVDDVKLVRPENLLSTSFPTPAVTGVVGFTDLISTALSAVFGKSDAVAPERIGYIAAATADRSHAEDPENVRHAAEPTIR